MDPLLEFLNCVNILLAANHDEYMTPTDTTMKLKNKLAAAALYSHKPLLLELLQQHKPIHHLLLLLHLPRTNQLKEKKKERSKGTKLAGHCLFVASDTNACPEEVQEGLHGAAPAEPAGGRAGVQVHGPPGAPGRRAAVLRRGDGAGVRTGPPERGAALDGVGTRARREARGGAAQRGAPAPHHGRRRLRDGCGGGEGQEGGPEQEDREEVAPGVQRRRREEEEQLPAGGGRRRWRRQQMQRNGGFQEDGEGEAAGAEEPCAGRGGDAWPLPAHRDAGLRCVPQDTGGAHAMPLQRIPFVPAGLRWMISSHISSGDGAATARLQVQSCMRGVRGLNENLWAPGSCHACTEGKDRNCSRRLIWMGMGELCPMNCLRGPTYYSYSLY